MENRSFTVKPKDVQVVCRQCNSYCTIPKVTSDSSTLLGSCSLVKVAYPPTQFLTEWRLPVDVQSTTQTTGQMPQSTVSTLASGLASTSLGDRASTLGIQLSPPKTVFLAPLPPHSPIQHHCQCCTQPSTHIRQRLYYQSHPRPPCQLTIIASRSLHSLSTLLPPRSHLSWLVGSHVLSQ
jgi:hypothetical protein